MQSYPLDLTTLLHILSRQKQTGKLFAEVRIPGSRKLGCAYLSLYNGNADISSCIIVVDENSVLTDREAFEYLKKLGTLEWVYTAQNISKPLPPASSSPVPASSSQDNAFSTTSFPVRVRVVTVEEFITWGSMHRLYRSVYNMADGRRTIEDIAAVLGKSVEAVGEILFFLLKHGVVRFLSESRRSSLLLT